ncbi:MAG TPA: adenylate/guanylate cyclase domain-containing protein [Stellaceae bacterium]|nr:adenylate/guanylate cyclase domain-containing protein [Stellaceae bacterium]
MATETATPPTEPVERKLATILSADVAEYSRLMAEDEEQTLRTFRAHRGIIDSLIAAHRGRIFNTAGDAVLAEFASAVEAVRCATEVQAALRTRNEQLPPPRQVKFRLGINLGDVMVQGDDLLGDGVNVAARLQAAAEPGGICISGSVYDQIRNKLSLSFKSLGEQSFKNIPQPVRTFTITESADQGALPSRRFPPLHAPALPWLAAAALAVLAISAGYWLYARMAPGVMQDGLYAGAVCYGPSRNDPARCYRAQGILSDGKLTGRWPGREPVATVFLSGEVSKAGSVKIEMHGETADGTRMPTINLVGTLRDGLIDAAGNFEGFGRTATLKWQRQ